MSGNISSRVYISFLNNCAFNKGGAILINFSTLQLCGYVFFETNIANVGGAIDTLNSTIYIGVNCSAVHVRSTTVTIVFCQNIALYSGGSISSIDSRLYFMGNTLFDGNTAGYGGAIILDIISNLILTPNLTTQFINNRANEEGGVFYYDHSLSSCDHFIQYYNYSLGCFVSYKGNLLTFFNNSASKAGSLIYSGKLGTCFYSSGGKCLLKKCNIKLRQNLCSNLHLDLKNVDYSSEISGALSADTEEVKFCTLPHYSQTHNVMVYAGKKFNVSLIATGTLNLTVTQRFGMKI